MLHLSQRHGHLSHILGWNLTSVWEQIQAMGSSSSWEYWHLLIQHPNTCVTHIEYLGVGSLLDQVQPVVLSNFCVSHNKILLLSLCPHFSSLGVPYNHEIWLCHLINTIAARCTAPSAPSEAFVAATREYKALHAGDGKVKVNILAGGNIYGKNLWIRELYSFHWHFLTALTFYISCG